MTDFTALYLTHGLHAIVAEDLQRASQEECSEALEWAADYKHWGLFDMVLPFANPTGGNAYALRKCIEHGHARGVRALLPHNNLRVPHISSKFCGFATAVYNNHADVLTELVRPVCTRCRSFDCGHGKEVVGGIASKEGYQVLYGLALKGQHEMFKTLLAACDEQTVRTNWEVEWKLKTPIATLFDQTVAELAIEQGQRISEHLPKKANIGKRKM